MKRQWIRLYTKVRTDPKVQKLPPPVFRFWINLLCVAGERDTAVVSPCDRTAIDMRSTKDQVTRWLRSLHDHGLIDLVDQQYVIHDWEEYQYDSDSSTERVKRYRKRQRNVSETLESRAEADTEQKQSRHTEVDLNTPPLPPQAAAAAASPARPPDAFAAVLDDVFRSLIAEGVNLPPRYVENGDGRMDRNPASERIDQKLRSRRDKILAARKPAALARKIILDELA